MSIKGLNDYFIRIIILNYNESSYTIDLIEQLRRQSLQNFEIIVVDNDSRAEEKQILKDRLPSDVVAIYSPQNVGYAAGNNLGLRYAGSIPADYFLILNNDLILEDEKLIDSLLSQIVANKGNGVVAASPIVDTVSTGTAVERQIQVRRIMSMAETFLLNIPLLNMFTRKIRSTFLYQKEMPYVNKILLCDTINGAAFMIEKEFMVANNYLDTGTFLYFEEIILGRQIMLDRKKCLLNGFTSVKHLQGISTKSSAGKINTRMERFKYRSALYYLQKYDGMGIVGAQLFVLLSEASIMIKKLIR